MESSDPDSNFSSSFSTIATTAKSGEEEEGEEEEEEEEKEEGEEEVDVVMLSQVAVLDQLVYRLLALLLMPTQFFFLAGRNKIVQNNIVSPFSGPNPGPSNPVADDARAIDFFF